MNESKLIINENCLLKINLNLIEFNYSLMLQKISKRTILSAVLKSNSYGLGLKNIAEKLISSGCSFFFLNSLSEAVYIRKISQESELFLLNGVIDKKYKEIKKIFQNKISPVINSIEELEKIIDYKKRVKNNVNVSLHFDTGINRLGIEISLAEQIKNLCELNNLNIKCVMSHLIASDEKNALNKIQKEKFDKIIKFFPNSIHSLSNSNAIIKHKTLNYGMVRSGGNIFGLNSDEFRPVFSVFARILQIKTTEESINHFGYNSTFKAKNIKKIAIIGAGYADGYPRILSNLSEVFYIKKLPIIGSISMDYMIIDITKLNDESIKVGNWVELLGENIKIQDIAKKSKTIPYEILINICSRAKKQYIG